LIPFLKPTPERGTEGYSLSMSPSTIDALYLNLKDDYAIFDSRLIKPLMINLLGNECYRKETYENINRFYYIFNFTYLMKQINDELKFK